MRAEIEPSNGRVYTFPEPSLELGHTPDLAAIFAQVGKAAKARSSTIMLLGETGVGKTRLASYIHSHSPRRAEPFGVADLSQVSHGDLFDSTLFGHERGAYTGAIGQRNGILEEADGGTVFLDEVGTLPLPLQSKLLRLVQEQRFRRLGGTKDIQLNVRFVVATSTNLEEKVRKGEFREDLFYRLNVVPIKVPPLRERPNDIFPLAQHFLKVSAAKDGLPRKTISAEAAQLLRAYTWPGNVRELENMMSYLTVMADNDDIAPTDLPGKFMTSSNLGQTTAISVSSSAAYPTKWEDLRIISEEVRRHLIMGALSRNQYSAELIVQGLGFSSVGALDNCFRTIFKVRGYSQYTALQLQQKWDPNVIESPFSDYVTKLIGFGNIGRIDEHLNHERDNLLKNSLLQNHFIQSRAAVTLGIDETTFCQLLNKRGLREWRNTERANYTVAMLIKYNNNRVELASVLDINQAQLTIWLAKGTMAEIASTANSPKPSEPA